MVWPCGWNSHAHWIPRIAPRRTRRRRGLSVVSRVRWTSLGISRARWRRSIPRPRLSGRGHLPSWVSGSDILLWVDWLERTASWVTGRSTKRHLLRTDVLLRLDRTLRAWRRRTSTRIAAVHVWWRLSLRSGRSTVRDWRCRSGPTAGASRSVQTARRSASSGASSSLQYLITRRESHSQLAVIISRRSCA